MKKSNGVYICVDKYRQGVRYEQYSNNCNSEVLWQACPKEYTNNTLFYYTLNISVILVTCQTIEPEGVAARINPLETTTI